MESEYIPLEELAEIPTQRRVATAFTVTMPETNPRPPTTEDALEKMTKNFTHALTEITQQFLHATTSRNLSPPKNVFSGAEQEDPMWFMRNFETYFEQAGIFMDADRISAVESQLRGEARRWYEPYKYTQESYETFRNRFESYFCSSKRIAAATTMLYGEVQIPKESVASFIIKKRALFQRLAANTTEDYRVSVVVNQLLPEIRQLLRCGHFRDLEDLINIASEIEADQKASHLNRNSNVRENFQNPPPQALRRTFEQPQNCVARPSVNPMCTPVTGENRREPNSPCKFCQQWHFHSQCPQNPYRQSAVNAVDSTSQQPVPKNDQVHCAADAGDRL